MMTALIIGSVLLAGLTQVFVASRQGYKLSESMGYLQESGRLALYTVSDEMRRAGWWGGNADVAPFSLGSTTALVPPTAANFNTCPNSTVWALMMAQRAFGLDDSAGTYSCIPNSGTGEYLRGDVVVSRHADSQQVTDVDMATRVNTLFLRTDLFEGHVFTGSNATDELNKVSGSAELVAQYALAANGFYVGASGATCEGEKVPALFRISLTDAGVPQVQNLIAGVEDLQVQWGLDTDPVADGVPNQYLDAGAVNWANWNWPATPGTSTIVSARIWVLARAECPDPTYKNDQTYEYGNKIGTLAFKPGDHYRRQLFSTTIALRN
jgi:type IV pilus assembly protein PilW